MNKLLSIILLLGCAQVSHGRFSKFAHVTPSTEKEYKLSLSITKKNNDLYTVKFPWEKQSKQCWLIVFEDSEAFQKNLDFRQVIWNRGKIIPKGISRITPLQETQDGYIEVDIKKEEIPHSYISIDFPTNVMDGGYYYTIDLPSYLKSF